MVNVIHKRVLIVALSWICVMLSDNYSYARSEKISAASATCFIENKGQVTDQFFNARKDIDFKVPGGSGLNIFIGSGKMHYMWSQAQSENGETDEALDRTTHGIINTYRLDVFLEGANSGVQPVTEHKAAYYENYYTPGLNGVTVSSYKKITYRNIYNNIDWVLYVQDGSLKYDFIVRPGGNVEDIRIRYEGAEELKLIAGNLKIVTPYGSVTEKKPYSYHAYTRHEVPSAYKLSGNTMSFEAGDHTGTLVIDPSLEWASYMGGTGEERGYGIIADTQRNIYIVGSSESNSTNVASSGSFQSTLVASSDGFIVKYSPGGARQWGTYYGGHGFDVINSMTITTVTNELVYCGYTDTSSTLYVKNAHQAHHGGGDADCFLGKINSAGQIQWASYYGGAGAERIGLDFQTDIKSDEDGNVYLVGLTNSDTGIATSSTAQSARGGDLDGFIAKFNISGVRQWGTYYGGTYDDAFTNVAVSPTGYVYVAGQFKSGTLGTSGTFSPNRLSSNNSTANNTRDADILIAKFNPANGTRIWATYYGGNAVQSGSGNLGLDESRGIAVSDTSMVYFSGSTQNISGIATSGAQQTTYGGGYFDAFLVKLDSNGSRIWGSYCGGSGVDLGGNAAIDDAGSIYITGRTTSSNNISTPDGHQTSFADVFDAMMVIYSPGGVKTWGSYYGGPDADYGYSLSAAGLGHMYLCGNSTSSTNIEYGGYQSSKAGGNDAFLAKFTPDTTAFIFQPFTYTEHCQEDSFSFEYGVTAPFHSGNVFNVELSDNTGSFANPIVIGSVQTTDPGFVKCGIPNTVSGTGFRIRILSTSPIDTSEDNGLDIEIIELPAKPVASNNGPVCSNDTLILSTTNSGTNVVYNWVGPAGYDNTKTDTFAWRLNMTASTMSGDYVVTADNRGCARKDTTSVTIIQASDKPFLQSNAPLCQGDTLKMNVQGMSTGATLKWEGPDNWTDTAATWSGIPFYADTRPNMQANNAGQYYVIAWMNGCDSRDTIDVTVGPRPAPVTITGNSPVCTNDSIKLSALTSTPNVVYNWTGPAMFTRYNSQDVVRKNLTTIDSGEYIVEANLAGCRVYDTMNVVVLRAPEPPVAGAGDTLCSGETYILKSVYAQPNTATVTWTVPWTMTPFSDPDTITNMQTNYTGDYILNVVMPNGCALHDTMYVEVLQSTTLAVNIEADPGTALCPTGHLILYPDPLLPNLRPEDYRWRMPAPGSPDPAYVDKDTVEVPSVDYGHEGWYVLKVTESKCAIGYDSVFIDIVDTLSNPVLTLPSTLCEGDSLNVNMKHSHLNQFTLYGPGDTSTGSKILLKDINKPDHEGRFILKVESAGCVAYDTGYVSTVFDQPDRPTASSNAPLCEGETLQLDATSSTGAGVNYEWRGPASYLSKNQNATLSNVDTPDNDGYYMAFTQLNGCYSVPDSVYVKVHPNPDPSINIAPGTQVCAGDSVILDLDISSSTITYVWSVINNSSYSGRGPGAIFKNLEPGDSGGFVVSATSSLSGCVGTDTIIVDVTPYPDLARPFYNSPICAGDKVEFGVEDTTDGASYAWQGPNGFMFTQKDAFINGASADNIGTYYVYTSVKGCESVDSVVVDVKPTPDEPQLTSNSPIKEGEDLELEVLNPQAGASYQWRGPGGFGSRVQNPVIFNVTRDAAGTYTLTTSLDGCTNSGITVVVIENGEADREKLILYPNPNDGNFTVTAELARDQIMPYEVVSELGTVVYQGVIESQNQSMEMKVNLSGGLPSGVYVFRIMMSGNSWSVPFTVVR